MKCSGEIRFSIDLRDALNHPGMQGIEQRHRVSLTCREALLGRTTADMILDLIQTANALESLFGERRVQRDLHLKKMPPRMGHAGNLFDARRNPRLSRQEQRLKA